MLSVLETSEANLLEGQAYHGLHVGMLATLRWVKSHKLHTAVIVLLLFLVLEYLSLPSTASIERLRNERPHRTALMVERAAEAKEKRKKFSIRQQWVPLSSISSELIHAVIVAEDGTFYEHKGIDWYEVQESIERNLEETEFVRGASTITQQLAKNLHLSTSKDPIRKLKEYVITKRLEDALSKNRILEIYLNVIEWGEGIFGAEAASLHHFGKHASELTREEAARLAAVIPNPRRLKANSEAQSVVWRKNVVLERMRARGW